MKRWAIISVIFITIFAIFIGCQRRESTKEEVYKEFPHFDFYYTVDFLLLAYSFFKNA